MIKPWGVVNLMVLVCGVPHPRQTAAVIGLNSSDVMFLHRSDFVMDLF